MHEEQMCYITQINKLYNLQNIILVCFFKNVSLMVEWTTTIINLHNGKTQTNFKILACFLGWQQFGSIHMFYSFRFMACNVIFNNISVVILWRSVLLVEEIRLLRENHQPATSHWHNVVLSTPCHEQDSNSQL